MQGKCRQSWLGALEHIILWSGRTVPEKLICLAGLRGGLSLVRTVSAFGGPRCVAA